jgi:hypothetical protein
MGGPLLARAASMAALIMVLACASVSLVIVFSPIENLVVTGKQGQPIFFD